MTLDIRVMPDYLHATIAGEYEFEAFKNAYARIVEAANQHQQVKILADCRGISGNPPKHERQEFGKYAVSLRFEALMAGRISGYEIAFLAYPPVMDPDRLALKEARSRGLRSMIFEKDEDALAWLGIKTEPG